MRRPCAAPFPMETAPRSVGRSGGRAESEDGVVPAEAEGVAENDAARLFGQGPGCAGNDVESEVVGGVVVMADGGRGVSRWQASALGRGLQDAEASALLPIEQPASSTTAFKTGGASTGDVPCTTGSSPRTRRAARVTGLEAPPAGVIPACAGAGSRLTDLALCSGHASSQLLDSAKAPTQRPRHHSAAASKVRGAARTAPDDGMSPRRDQVYSARGPARRSDTTASQAPGVYGAGGSTSMPSSATPTA